MEFTQTVNVEATNDVEIGRKVRAIKRIASLRCLQDGAMILLDSHGVHRATMDGRFETLAERTEGRQAE